MRGRLFRSALVMFLAFSLIPGSPAFAQDQQQTQTPSPSPSPTPGSAQSTPIDPQRDLRLHVGREFSNGKSWFPNIIAPYTPMHMEHPGLTNSPALIS